MIMIIVRHLGEGDSGDESAATGLPASGDY